MTSRANTTPGYQSIWALDAIPGLSRSEAEAFDYFRQVVAPSLAEDLDKDFWAVNLPQISHGNAKVRYAVLTISALYQDPFPYSWTQAATTARDAKYKKALAWYTRSLSGFSSSLRDCSRDGATPPTAEEFQINLLSCLLFTTIEFQQNNVLNACKLLYHGFSMVEDASCFGLDLVNMMSGAVINVMTQMLDRQRLVMTLFGHMPPPTINGRQDSTIRSSSHQHQHPAWKTLNEARIDLYDPLYRTSQLIRVARITESQGSISATTSLLAEQGSILDKFHKWHQSFEAFQRSREPKAKKQDLRGATSLQLFHQTAQLWAETCLLSEFDNDSFLHRFKKIIDLSKQLLETRREHEHRPATFSFEMGTVAPVYLLGWKCRDPGVRQEALDLLRRSRGQEALYSASLHGRALEQIIEIEEAANADACSREEASDDGDGLEVVAEKQRRLARYRVRNVTIHYERPDGAKVQPVLIYDMQCANGRLTEERMLLL